jgi:hypothetical protein
LSGQLASRHVRRQLGLLVLLVLTFASEFACGIALIVNPRSSSAAGTLGNLLVALLLIGVARAWELIAHRETSIIASIAVLTGHDQKAAATSTGQLPAWSASGGTVAGDEEGERGQDTAGEVPPR